MTYDTASDDLINERIVDYIKGIRFDYPKNVVNDILCKQKDKDYNPVWYSNMQLLINTYKNLQNIRNSRYNLKKILKDL